MQEINLKKRPCEENGTCPVGGCGSGKGMCPGLALMIGVVAGSGISLLPGLDWIDLPITIIVALLLILGFYPTGGNWPFKTKSEVRDL